MSGIPSPWLTTLPAISRTSGTAGKKLGEHLQVQHALCGRSVSVARTDTCRHSFNVNELETDSLALTKYADLGEMMMYGLKGRRADL